MNEVDSARNELQKRGSDNVRAESNQQVMDRAQLPVLLENVSGHKVFSTGQIIVASFLGTPMAGCLLIAQNYRALGKKSSAWPPLVVGVAATILLLVLAFLLPENSPNYGLPAGSCVGTYFYAKQQQGDAIDNYLKAGGKRSSWWIPIAVSLGCAVISLILVIAIALAFDISSTSQ